MSYVYRRLTSNKLVLVTGIIIGIYILLRGVAFFQNQPSTVNGNYYSFNDKQVRYVCEGRGEPYVFLETGFGSDSEATWSHIVNELPDTFTTCYYDRLGHGGSDDVPRTFSTDDKSQLQEALIQHIAGNAPVILIAHSYGGIIARRTAARENVNLSALILLDSAHENQHTVLAGKLDPIAEHVKVFQYVNAALGLSAIKNIFKKYNSPMSKRLDQYYASLRWAHVLSSYRNEKGFYTPLEEFHYDFGNLRILVMSHDPKAYAGNPRFSSVSDDWANMQQSIAMLSDNSELIIVDGATHNIPGDAPDAVVKQIIETVSLVSKKINR